VGSLLGVLEKTAEAGSVAEDSEKNDVDKYLLGLVTKAGAVNILPLIAYVQNGSNDLADDSYDTILSAKLGANGMFGMVGFEGALIALTRPRGSTTTASGVSTSTSTPRWTL
jgi:hypothetical protein